MATTTYKQKLSTGRTVEFGVLTMKHFDLFLETLNENKSLLTFYTELLIENGLLVAVGKEAEDETLVLSKDEKDKLTLLPCELYETMLYVRIKSIGTDLAIKHEWEKGKPSTHRFDLSKLDSLVIDFKIPSEKEILELTLSDKRVIMIQKGTLGQIRKHSHNIKKANATEMIAMHNPKEKLGEKTPISFSKSELKKLSWSDSPKLMNLCREANGSYSIAAEICNPLDKSETKKIDLLSYEGFAAFFGLEDSL